MRMVRGDVNVYWFHDTLTRHNVRAASYGSQNDSGRLVPDEGDVIRDFPGLYGVPLTVRVEAVMEVGDGTTAYEVTVVTVDL